MGKEKEESDRAPIRFFLKLDKGELWISVYMDFLIETGQYLDQFIQKDVQTL